MKNKITHTLVIFIVLISAGNFLSFLNKPRPQYRLVYDGVDRWAIEAQIIGPLYSCDHLLVYWDYDKAREALNCRLEEVKRKKDYQTRKWEAIQ